MEKNSYKNQNKRIMKNSIYLYLRMILVLLISLYTTRIVLNTLGVTDYGIYNVVGGFVSLLAFLKNAMDTTIQRFYNYDRSIGGTDALRMTYTTSIQIQITLAFLIFILLESLGLYFIYNYMVIPQDRFDAALWVFHFSVLSLVMLVLQIPYSAAVISHERMDYYAIVSIVDVVLKLLIVIILPHISFDQLIFYGILSLLVSVINFLFYYIYSKRNFEEITLVKRFDKVKFKEMISFSGYSLFDAFAYTLQGHGTNVLINAFFGPVVNAARAVAFQIQGAISAFSGNIAIAFRPQVVESFANKEYKRTCNLMYAMSKFCYIMLFTLSLPIAIDLHNTLNLWLKGTIPDHTIVFTYLVIATMIVNSLNMPITQVVQATGKVKKYQVIRSLIVASTLPLSYVALKIVAEPSIVFWVTLLITIINLPVSLFLLRKVFQYNYKEYVARVIIPCLVFSILVPLFPIWIHLMMNESLVRLIVVCVTSLFSSLVVLYFVVLNKSEKNILKQFIFRSIHR